MKKTFLFIIIVSYSINSLAQKKNKKTITSISKTVITQTDGISVEAIKNNFYVLFNNGLSKDTLSKTVGNKQTDCKIIPFNAKTNKLYLVSWIEKNTTQTATKTEDKTLTYSEIFDTNSKSKVFSNIQTSTKIKEQVFLDKLKNASETQERTRNEGFVVTILPDGDLSLKTKTQENKMTFDLVAKKYIDAKKRK